MKTSISSEAFVALPTDRRTKYLQNRCSFMILLEKYMLKLKLTKKEQKEYKNHETLQQLSSTFTFMSFKVC